MAVYIAVRGETTGPFGRAELEAKIASGELTAQTMVWQDGMAAWLPAGQVEALRPLLDKAPPPPASFDAAQYMLGQWENFSPQVPLVDLGMTQMTTQLTISPDGSFSLSGKVDAFVQGMPLTLSVSGGGRYTVEAVGDQQFRFQPNGKMVISLPGIYHLEIPLLQTALYRRVDQNTFIDEYGESYRRLR